MRIIIHFDMDAFFAAVEERYNPKLRGLPIVVGADPKDGRGRGVVSTANYEARKFGIHSAMPISQAWQLAETARRKGAPATVFLGGNSELYREVSRRVMAIAERGVDVFEEASIDEAYLELKVKSQKLKVKNADRPDPWTYAEDLARSLKAEILKREGLTSTVGIGPNKLIAKIASSFKKPDGLTVIRSEQVERFLDPLSVREIPGIGPKTEVFLRQKGIRRIQELRKISEAELAGWFGKWGHDLYRKARGVDDSPVTNEWIPKSIGEQETFERDTRSPSFLTEQLFAMAEDIIERVKEEGFKGFRTVTLTVRFHDFETKNRSRTLPEAILISRDASKRLKSEAMRLLMPFLDRRENPRRKLTRLLGLRVEKLVA